MKKRWRLAACAAVMLVLSGCGKTSTPLSQQAYVWQRSWPASVASELVTQKPGLAGWRVLLAESVDGRWQSAAPDWSALAASGLPVTLVVRIDGHGAERPDAAALLALWARAKSAAALAGLSQDRLTTLEIDHDCASSRLAGYAAWLHGLRDGLHQQGARLAITALPSWLEARSALSAVLAEVDEHVLQVHAVRPAHEGLWNAEQTEAWLDAWAAANPVPFAVALPSYGSAVRIAPDGSLLEVLSSAPAPARVWPAGTQQLELSADPLALARFLLRLQARHPEQLRAIYWFRLPLPDEPRSFSPASWQRLRTDPQGFVDASEQARLHLKAEAVEEGVWRWRLVNTAPVDMTLPEQLQLPANCTQVFVTTNASSQGLKLQPRAGMQLLRSGQALPIAIARCPGLTAAQQDQTLPKKAFTS